MRSVANQSYSCSTVLWTRPRRPESEERGTPSGGVVSTRRAQGRSVFRCLSNGWMDGSPRPARMSLTAAPALSHEIVRRSWTVERRSAQSSSPVSVRIERFGALCRAFGHESQAQVRDPRSAIVRAPGLTIPRSADSIRLLRDYLRSRSGTR
jgi:hypothetical protein